MLVDHKRNVLSEKQTLFRETGGDLVMLMVSDHSLLQKITAWW